MAQYPLKFPPGLMRNGTRYQAKGRWRDANLVRFLEQTVRPVGGWEAIEFDLRTALDTFTDDNDTLLNNHTPDSGFGGWTVLESDTGNGTQVIDIQNNAVRYFGGSTTGLKRMVLRSTSDVLPSVGEFEARVVWTRDETAVGSHGGGVSFYLASDGVFDNAGGTQGDLYTGWPEGVHVLMEETDANNVRPRLLEFENGNTTAVTDTTTTLATIPLTGTNGIAVGVTVSGQNVTVWWEPPAGGVRTTITTLTLATDFVSEGNFRAGVCGHLTSGANPSLTYDNLTVIGEFQAITEEIIRAVLAWRDNESGAGQLALGSNLKLYVMTQGVITDITPTGLTTGAVDSASTIGSYGNGLYGGFNFGEGDPTQEVIIPAASWQLDTFGDFLLGVLSSDGVIHYWTGTGSSTAVTGAPTGCTGVVVTPERFVVALGADGDPRKIEWSGQEPDLASADEWNPLLTLSGSKILETPGDIMCGIVGKNETLILTTADLFAMQFIGGTLVYSVPQVGSNCGIISPHAKAYVDSKLIWMGQRGFFQYDGYVQSIPCEVSDYVFRNFNRMQREKCWALPLADFGEVWFFYPSSTSPEPDRYVIYNYREGHWTTGDLQRQAGVDRAVFDYPIMVGDNVLYDHERGSTRSGAGTPFLESAPIELGDGDRVIDLDYFVPDESTIVGQVLGSLRAFICTTLYPTDEEIPNGPFTLANPTSVRLSARQVRVRMEEAVAGDWRLGHVRLDGKPGSRR